MQQHCVDATPLLRRHTIAETKYESHFLTFLFGLDYLSTDCFRVALNTMYPWQNESNVYLPGGAISVARQFLRCVLHQLAPSGVFMQIFQTHVDGKKFLPLNAEMGKV